MKCAALGLAVSAIALSAACRTAGSNASVKNDDGVPAGVGEPTVVIGAILHHQGFPDYIAREGGGELSLKFATDQVAKQATYFTGVAHMDGARTEGSTFLVQSIRSASFPMAISCRVTGGKEEDGKPAKPSQEFKFGFGQINAAKGPVSNDEQGLIVDASDGAEKGQVIFDFGVRAHGGDQYSAYYFQEADVAALGAGKVRTITGKHETGYDWADGDHIALYDVECRNNDAAAAGSNRGGDPSSLGAYRLVQPKSIVKQAGGNYIVRYSAPCSESDFEGFVGHTDDSGDMSVHVGVVYPVDRCVAGPMRDIDIVMLEDDASDKKPGDGGEFEPMRLGGGGFMAAPAQIKKQGDKLIATFSVPCSEIDFEAYAKAIDDSGNRDMAVAVVFAKRDCRAGVPKKLTREIEKDDPHFGFLGGGEGDSINYVPMSITVVPPSK